MFFKTAIKNYLFKDQLNFIYITRLIDFNCRSALINSIYKSYIEEKNTLVCVVISNSVIIIIVNNNNLH